MRRSNRRIKIICGSTILLITLACSVSFNTGTGESNAEQTLQAIYYEQTLTAQEPASAPQTSSGDEEALENETSPVEVNHSIIPGNPGSADVTKDEIDTSNTAADKIALGDSFRLNNLERPFTEDDMVYHPEADMLELWLSKGTDFYYFTLILNGVGMETGYPSAYYGIEFDTDKDGRGDYLIWAQGDDNTEWNIDNVMLLEDSNDDVGGSSAVVPDSKIGDGFDKILFSIDKLDDPDMAWKRVDPSDGHNVQLAVKISAIDKARFFWRAWADAGVGDPSKFDYNDSYSESQAGSPTSNSQYYPVGELNLMDSTCWIAYNLEPTGTELGGCYVLQPTAEPPPPDEPQPVCACPAHCGTIFDRACCIYCGCTWGGGEFPCF